MPLYKRRLSVDPQHLLSIRKQCSLLCIHRSGWYYEPVGESALNLELMRLMDEHYLSHPYKGAKRMHVWLTKDKGYQVNLKRVRRLYRLLGLRSLLPGPNTSRAAKRADHQVFPYLLRGYTVKRANEVWAMDITYLPLKGGYLYLVAIIDLYSRYAVHWSISNTMDAKWCVQTLEQAIEWHGIPTILNTDQGAQFTSKEFVQTVQAYQGLQLSMDGKGRCIDNVFIERLWWSLKYECIYLNEYLNGKALFKGVSDYFEYYNHHRRHSSIDNEVPARRFTLCLSSSFFEEERQKANLIYLNPA